MSSVVIGLAGCGAWVTDAVGRSFCFEVAARRWIRAGPSAIAASSNSILKSSIVGRSAGSWASESLIACMIGRSAGSIPPGTEISPVAPDIRSRNVGRWPVIRWSIVAANEYTSAGGPMTASPSSSSGLAYASVSDWV